MTARPDWLLKPRSLILGAVLAGLLGLGLHALNREARSGPASATAQKVVEPRRPALTAAEEQYISALWPIHGDVERSTVRMSLGQIFYKTQNLSRAELGTRVKEALASYQAAQTRLGALQPPASLRGEHEAYVTALRLFQESATEVLKMFSDARDDHMLAAYPSSQEASNKIREVGGKFWPHEFPPN